MDNNLPESIFSPDTAKMVVIAAFFGSILSMNFVDGMTRKQRIFAVISGMVLAHYLAPLIASLFHEEQYQETIGFLIGLFGMSVCGAIFRAIQNSDIWALIVKHFSRDQV